MKLCALLIIVILAMILPWEVGAGYVMREDLKCPLRQDWGQREWDQWEKEERKNDWQWSEECPCAKGWKPTKEQLQEMLAAHKIWSDGQTLIAPAVSGKSSHDLAHPKMHES